MINYATKILPLILTLCLAPAGLAQLAEAPSQEVALTIIASHEELKPRLFKIVHITTGTLQEKCGFTHDQAISVTALGPKSAGDTTRVLKKYTLLYSQEYGWYLQRISTDSRGIFIEISSQRQGKVFVR